ncbi:hypothetical protein L195_g048789, partial [Trifolium pratense]
ARRLKDVISQIDTKLEALEAALIHYDVDDKNLEAALVHYDADDKRRNAKGPKPNGYV